MNLAGGGLLCLAPNQLFLPTQLTASSQTTIRRLSFRLPAADFTSSCTRKNPKEVDLRAALAELAKPDEEHPDCWLSDENGWTIAAHQSGKVVLENPESDEGPWHMKNQTHESILDLWRLLQAGDIQAIRAKAWNAGYQ